MGFKLEHTIAAKTKKESSQKGLEGLLKKEITLFGDFFNNKRKEDFYSELAVLLKAGVHLREGLQLLGENQKKEKLKNFYIQMVENLDAGQSFYEVLKSKKEFTEYEYYSVQIGEESGNLPRIIEELGSFFSRKNEQRRQLLNAMTYPIIILCTAVLVVIFMLRMVVPMFEDIFRQNGVELPTITKWIIAASNGIKDYGWLTLLLIIGFILFRKVLFKKESVQRKRDTLLLKVPFLGQFIRSVYLSQFTQAVALLTASKVPVLNSIQMAKRMIRFYPLQDALADMESKIMKGVSLNESIKDNKIFDNKMASLIKVAEETNQTEYIFEKLNQRYTQEVQQKSKILSTIMEPLIIVVIGLFVGIILVSMYLPMFKLSSVLG
ncbi:MAG: general secretion pathway protein GspF [Muricauda sp.]|nr:type II secretion system F family protein [Allomuricauda sp.]MAU26789.1 general secretion pathway protein GspF [Allomuricauda sp.]MBC30718.1 general secretion pathway protein GspF [Allomuricauda sp.]|tara:strand:- start:81113 stop:82249 length:1137 start_codon:yes stop_codon:yes gene_type:complete